MYPYQTDPYIHIVGNIDLFVNSLSLMSFSPGKSSSIIHFINQKNSDSGAESLA